METSIDWGPIILGILMIGYGIWWKIKVDLPNKKKEKEEEVEELFRESEYKTNNLKKTEINSNETLLKLYTILEGMWVQDVDDDFLELNPVGCDYIELTPSILQNLQLKESIDILINHHQLHLNENNYVWVYSVLGEYLDICREDKTLIETILRQINFLKEGRGQTTEVVVTSYQDLEKCINKLQIKVKTDKEDLKTQLSKISKDLDKKNTGSLDVFKEDTFDLLLNKNEQEIILLEKDLSRKLFLDFERLSKFITTNKDGIIKQFDGLKTNNRKDILEKNIGLLEDQINTYNTILYLSISMVTTLINRDMIKFNKIYEVFDGLDVFTSKWENDIKNKLEDINQNLLEVIESIHQMSYKITNSLSSINTSIGDLSTSINKQLSSINSSVDLNTIITGINTYQLYKINKNTKSLN